MNEPNLRKNYIKLAEAVISVALKDNDADSWKFLHSKWGHMLAEFANVDNVDMLLAARKLRKHKKATYTIKETARMYRLEEELVRYVAESTGLVTVNGRLRAKDIAEIVRLCRFHA